MSKVATKESKITLGKSPYPCVPLAQIKVSERPEEGQEHTKLFFNPRFTDSFDSDAMEELRTSIKEVGLIHPLAVRITTQEEEITEVELISGERRFRSLLWLVENDEQVYDRDRDCMVSAKELYETVPCCVHYDIDDEKALRLACDENGKTKSLSVAEDIALVERLVRMNYSTEQIIAITGQHASWVSHTINFRKKLPLRAFEMLLENKLARSVAVNMLSFPEEDREVLLEAAIAHEAEVTSQKLEEIDEELEEANENEELAEWDEKNALKTGNVEIAKKAKKEKEKAEKQKEKAVKKKKKLESHSGVISQGDLQAGARKANLAPKTPKQLNRQDISSLIKSIDEWIAAGEYYDDQYEQEVGQDILQTVRVVASAIAEGDRDPVSIIRKVMIATDQWEDADALSAAEADCSLSEDSYDDEFEEDEEE